VATGGASSGKGGGIRAGRAFVETALDMAGLKGGLAQAKRMVLGFGKGLAVGGGALLGLGGSILAPVLLSFREVVDHFDKIQKAADRLSAPTEVVSGLGYAAEQSGSNLEQLEGAARKMQKTISDAAHEGGEAAETFRILGLDATKLAGMSLDDQFAAVA
jgi:hypothetical protein